MILLKMKILKRALWSQKPLKKPGVTEMPNE